MKKLLMMGAILALGTTMAYGKVEVNTKNSADVTVKAEIVSNGIIISDLDNGPIVLDFKKVSNQLTSGTSNTNEWYKVTLIGGAGDNVNKIKMTLDGETAATDVLLKHSNAETADTNYGKVVAKVGLDKYEASIYSVDFDVVPGTENIEYRGNITGTLVHGDQVGTQVTTATATGQYEGYATLTVQTASN